jgi:hypothetical protein
VASRDSDNPYAAPTTTPAALTVGRPIPGLERRARFVRILVSISIAIGVLTLIMTAVEQAQVDAVRSEGADELGPGDWVDIAVGLFYCGTVPWSLAAYISVLVWLHAAVTRVRSVKRSVGASPGWAVGSWFVPFANFYVPFRTVRELWRKSHTPVAFRVPGYFGLWWAAWLVSSIAGGVSGRLTMRDAFDEGADIPPNLIFGLDYVSSTAHVVAGCLLLRIVREVTVAQERLFDAVE